MVLVHSRSGAYEKQKEAVDAQLSSALSAQAADNSDGRALLDDSQARRRHSSLRRSAAPSLASLYARLLSNGGAEQRRR